MAKLYNSNILHKELEWLDKEIAKDIQAQKLDQEFLSKRLNYLNVG